MSADCFFLPGLGWEWGRGLQLRSVFRNEKDVISQPFHMITAFPPMCLGHGICRKPLVCVHVYVCTCVCVMHNWWALTLSFCKMGTKQLALCSCGAVACTSQQVGFLAAWSCRYSWGQRLPACLWEDLLRDVQQDGQEFCWCGLHEQQALDSDEPGSLRSYGKTHRPGPRTAGRALRQKNFLGASSVCWAGGRAFVKAGYAQIASGPFLQFRGRFTSRQSCTPISGLLQSRLLSGPRHVPQGSGLP